MASVPQRYDVGGVMLPRPFKIRRLGHFGFNVFKLAEGIEFYTNLLGFRLSDTLDFSRAPWFPKDADLGDPRGYFMRYGTDHHAFVLFNKKVMDFRADPRDLERSRQQDALDVVRRGHRFARAVTGEEVDALGERFGHLGDLGHLWQ